MSDDFCQTFAPGDVVLLKSGGPLMTVQDFITGGEVMCIWFIGQAYQRESFAPEVLKLGDAPR